MKFIIIKKKKKKKIGNGLLKKENQIR
jgi:hypothetical protein